MANFPFPPKAKVTNAAPAAPVGDATNVVMSEPTKNDGVKMDEKPKKTRKSGEDRKKPAPPLTAEQVKQIISMVKDHSYSEIAESLGITKFQVNRVLMTTKSQLRKSAEGDPEKLAKVEEYIKTHLTRPEESRPGAGGARGGKVKSALDDIVGDILSNIG